MADDGVKPARHLPMYIVRPPGTVDTDSPRFRHRTEIDFCGRVMKGSVVRLCYNFFIYR